MPPTPGPKPAGSNLFDRPAFVFAGDERERAANTTGIPPRAGGRGYERPGVDDRGSTDSPLEKCRPQPPPRQTAAGFSENRDVGYARRGAIVGPSTHWPL